MKDMSGIKTKNKQELPEWFNGDVYNEGGVVTNPFSGECYTLTAEELAMYDFIMGAQMMFDMGMQNHKILNDYHKGLRWFSKNNIDPYMVLLD